jgi:serine/threonine protein kinase
VGTYKQANCICTCNNPQKSNFTHCFATHPQIAAAMSYLHDLDIVHGDLSSFNVLLTSASTEAARASRGFSAKVSGA